MSLYAQFETDPKKEQEGVWVEDFLPNEDGTVPGFLVRRCNKRNAEYAKKFEEVTRPYRRLIDLGKLGPDLNLKLAREAWIGTGLIGWRNQRDRQGNDLGAFSPELAEILFDDLPDLYDVVYPASFDVSRFKPDTVLADLEGDAKN